MAVQRRTVAAVLAPMAVASGRLKPVSLKPVSPKSLWLRYGVFGPLPLARAVLRWRYAGDLRVIEAALDAEFYRRQLPGAGMRLAMGRDPALHYLLVGAPRLLAPHPAFDAVAHFHRSPGVPRRRTFLHAWAEGQFPCPAPVARPEPGPAGVALLIDHARGGGSTRYLEFHAARLAAEGFAVVRAVRSASAEPLFVVPHGQGHRAFSLAAGDLAQIVALLGVTRLVINHFVDMPQSAMRTTAMAARSLGLAYDVLVHDYFMACPRINLVDGMGRFCDLPGPQACAACLGPAGPDVARWRQDADHVLLGAARVVAPGRDLARRLARVFPEVRFAVHEPQADPAFGSVSPAGAPVPAGRLRVAVLGALSTAKGFHVLADLARLARRRGEGVEFVLLGHSMNDRVLKRAGVAVTGRYAEDDVDRLLREAGIDLVLFPAIWPETWSFTLSTALRWGGAIAAFDLGEIADRLRRVGHGALLPCALAGTPGPLLDAVLRLADKGRQDAVARARRGENGEGEP